MAGSEKQVTRQVTLMYRDSVQEKLCLQNEGQVKRMTTLSVYSLQSLNFIKFVFFSQLKKKTQRNT